MPPTTPTSITRFAWITKWKRDILITIRQYRGYPKAADGDTLWGLSSSTSQWSTLLSTVLGQIVDLPQTSEYVVGDPGYDEGEQCVLTLEEHGPLYVAVEALVMEAGRQARNN